MKTVILFALFSVVVIADVATNEIDAKAMKNFFNCVQHYCNVTNNKCQKDSTCCISNCMQKLNINTCMDSEVLNQSLLKALQDLLNNVIKTLESIIGGIKPQNGTSDLKPFKACINKTCAAKTCQKNPKECITQCMKEIKLDTCREPQGLLTGIVSGLLNVVRTLVKNLSNVVDDILKPVLG